LQARRQCARRLREPEGRRGLLRGRREQEVAMSSSTPRPARPAPRFSHRPGAQPLSLPPEEVRAGFIPKAYLHLFGAVLAFTFLEFAYFKTGLALPIAKTLLSTSWLVVLGGFI